MIFDIEVVGGNSISIMSNRIGIAAERAANDGAERLAQYLRNFTFETPTGSHGPPFSDSINVVPLARGGDVAVMVTSDSDHAVYIEEGTKGPYVIVPKNAKSLVFDGREIYDAENDQGTASGFKRVFAKRVIHPGIQNPPKPFEWAISQNRQFIVDLFDDYLAAEFSAAAATSTASIRSVGIIRGVAVPLISELAFPGAHVGRAAAGTGHGGQFARLVR